MTEELAAAAFLRAAGEGDLAAIDAALAADPDVVNATGPHPFWGGRPQALHVAIEANRPDVFARLLGAGAAPSGYNDDYELCSPLMLSVLWERDAMRDTLLARGARVGLGEALLLQRDEAVNGLLDGAGALPDARPNGGSWLALARTPHAIDRLLALGASVDQQDRWGTPPVEALCRLGESARPLVRHLVSCLETEQAVTGLLAPADLARMNDRSGLMAHPGDRLDDAVVLAAVEFGHRPLVAWLLDEGASANATAVVGSGQSALHAAAWNGDLEMVELLLARGANIAARDAEHRNTPLGWARTARVVTNNSDCDVVVAHLEAVEQSQGL